jgi:DHA1 family tetracycline resistance protein-like MFS transporter
MRKALFTIFLIVFIDLVGFGIMLPNQQYYGELFGIENVFFLTLIGPAYSFFQFLFAPILGKWSDRIGRRPALIISQIGTLIGYFILYAAHFQIAAHAQFAIFLLYFSRVLDGITGGNISIASAYIADIMPPEKRAKGMGLIGAALGLGFMFGPFIGGTVGKHFGLEYVPIAAAAFSFAALLSTIFFLPESLPIERRVQARVEPYASIFHAVIDRLFGIRHALARPTIGALIAMSFVNGFAFAGMEQTFSLLIQERGKLSAKEASGAAGYIFGTIGVIIIVVQGGLIGRLTKRLGESALVLIGPILIAIGLALVGSSGSLFLGVWAQIILGSCCMALGSSLFNPSIQSLISRHAAGHEQGEVLGAAQGMSSLARAIGPLLAGFLFWYFSSGVPYYVSASICLLVALWAVSMRHRLVPPRASAAPGGMQVEPNSPESLPLTD